MFIAERIRNNLGRRNINHLKEAGETLELTVGVPVRFLMPERGRTVDGHTRRWTGNSGSMEHYPGFTEEDRDERGITVLFSSFNEALGRARWNYVWVPGDAWTPELPQAPLEWELHRPEGASEDAIAELGGIPLTWDTEHGRSVYGELYEGRVMFLSFGPGYGYNWGSWNWEKQFQPLIDNATPEARAAAADRMAERNREVFTQLVRDQGNVALRELRDRGSILTEQIGGLQERLVNLLADHQQVGRQLQELLAREGEMSEDDIQREWTLLESNVNIERFSLGRAGGTAPRNENRRQRENRETEEREGLRTPEGASAGFLKIFTHMLYIENPETQRKMPLGKMEITLDFGTNTLRIKNLTHRQDNRWDHPHVSEGGLCDADFRTTITELLRQRQVAPMANMVFNILKVVTLNDPWGGNNILLWEEADNQWRRDNGHPEWSADEENHPLEVQEAGEAAHEVADEVEQTDDNDNAEDEAPAGDPDENGGE